MANARLLKTPQYEVQVAGTVVRVLEGDLEIAKAEALRIANGEAAVITIIYGSPAPSAGIYWDYDASVWTEAHPAEALQRAKAKKR